MVCYDFSGKQLWRKDLGKLEHIWGNASSPILYGNLCILWCSPGPRQFLLAVAKKKWARLLRVGAILAAATAGILPMLSQIFAEGGQSRIAPAWASVCLAAAGPGNNEQFGP
jgi:hypothetical protein